MKPTTEQLKDPEWWNKNIRGYYTQAYTTGPNWIGLECSIGDVIFVTRDGCIDGDLVKTGDHLWVKLCDRPYKEEQKK